MDYLNSLMGFLDSFKPFELVCGTLIVFVATFMAIWGFCRKLKQHREYLRVIRGEDKNLPESFSVLTTDGVHLTLERDWIDGKWRYMLKGELPYCFVSPESKKEIDQLEIPECLKGKPEEQWLKNLDALTKPGGGYEEAVKSYYDQPEQVARRRAEEKLFSKGGTTLL
ncbi:MAG: hypothetical protein A3B04_01285 [Candidatus Portnoybacteria bacterium RIFCSPLOWO2_02_FULL_39_11]|uniref:Uncharacterized protein n=1 Tax=Candidatus Portnoybacteria bacterium RIFCSPLOWO2_02_FULL_39_11 TaxID=1802001 RepID=A0A1G2FU13_9BACT|nr:MAG: hypothetical protein A3B04_01285 [Candidatus Portnoybacteria bacterium RIFCSPLOWO2_02_FULL_39_11]